VQFSAIGLQDEITSRIAIALRIEIIRREAARPTVNPDALDCILRGRAALSKPPSRDTYSEAIRQFEHALTLDPQSVEAQSSLAGSLATRVLIGLSGSRAADLARADELIGRALAASPRHALPHYVKGQVLRAQNRWEEAIPEYETALASNPNFFFAITGLAWCKLSAGSIEEVAPLVEQASGLAPATPISALGTALSEWCICCNRAPTRRSSGSKKRAEPVLPSRSIISTSPPPMLSAATWIAPSARSPRPEG
jgi:adenylate cyclase